MKIVNMTDKSPPIPTLNAENRLNLTRRGAMGTYLAGASAIALSACVDPVTGHHVASKLQHRGNRENPAAGLSFAHGVAAGDPGPSSIILWTRLSINPATSPKRAEVELHVIGPMEILGSDDLTPSKDIPIEAGQKVRTQLIRTSAARDWTIKADVTGLKPGSVYLYTFYHGAQQSTVGRFKTLPLGSVESIRLAVASCGNWEHGHFNGYHHIAEQDFDAVLHLGDYIYEYGATPYTGPDGIPIGRLHEPAHEIITLQDYRERHAQYKTDPNLQKLHAAHAMIHLWDDHEISNDAWREGAQNHDSSEGKWSARRKAAMQAFYEWMPVREPHPPRPREQLLRSFEFGDIATIATLETRLMARDAPIDVNDHLSLLETDDGVQTFKNSILGASDRQMLGKTQLDWLSDTLRTSKNNGVSWQIIANQVLLSDLRVPDLNPYITEEDIAAIEPHSVGFREYVKHSRHELPLYFDCWSGYPAARERLLARLSQEGLTDTLILTGDAHEFWANDVLRENGERVGVELTTSSITSTTLGEVLGAGTEDFALLVTHKNDAARYYNPLVHGYIDLTLTKDKSVAQFIKLSSVSSPSYVTSIDASFNLYKYKNSIDIRRPRYLGVKKRLLFGKSYGAGRNTR